MPGIRLLVLDDDPVQIDLVSRALSRDGFDVRGASTLEEIAGLAEFAAQMALVDVNMPDLPSEQAVAAVRAAAPNAKVVLYSAWEESRLRGIARTLGADGFVSKSASVFELGGRLKAV